MGDVGFKPVKNPAQTDKTFNSFISGPTGKFTIKPEKQTKKK